MSLHRRHWPAVLHIQREKSIRSSSQVSSKESLLKARERAKRFRTYSVSEILWEIIDKSGFLLSGTVSMWPRKKLEGELNVLSHPESSVGNFKI